MASETFTKLWDWSCFLDLVKQYKNLDSCSCTETVEIVSDIKWCGLQIVSVVLRLSDRAIENLGVKCKESKTEESKDALFCFSRLVFNLSYIPFQIANLQSSICNRSMLFISF